MQEYGDSRIILTRRAKELAVALALIGLSFLKPYPLDPKFGLWIGEGVFIVVFALTYIREERRARHSPYSSFAILCKRIEDFAFMLTVAGFYLWGMIVHSDWTFIYACLITYVAGLLSGLLIGEVLWQNIRLPQMDDKLRHRYWAAYNDSLWVAE